MTCTCEPWFSISAVGPIVTIVGAVSAFIDIVTCSTVCVHGETCVAIAIECTIAVGTA